MPFVRREKLEELEARNARMASLLGEFESMSGILHLAGMLRDELVARIDEQPAMSAAEIGELAYRSVLASEIDAAHDDVIAKYEQQHRAELYTQVIKDVEEDEGDSILRDVEQRLGTDPELAVELRDSARKELAARALGVVTQEITEEQQEIINKEADRQIKLDRLDVEFAVDGELELLRDDVMKIIKPDDILEIYYKTDGSYSNEKSIVLQWAVDVNQKSGWILLKKGGYFYNTNGYGGGDIPTNRFLTIGSILPDLAKGKTKAVANTLKSGTPLAIMYEGEQGNKRTLSSTSSASQYNAGDGAHITRIDFQTRALLLN